MSKIDAAPIEILVSSFIQFRAANDSRIELAREMSADQVAEAQRLAREWLQTP